MISKQKLINIRDNCLCQELSSYIKGIINSYGFIAVGTIIGTYYKDNATFKAMFNGQGTDVGDGVYRYRGINWINRTGDNEVTEQPLDNSTLNNLVQCAKRLDEISVPSCSITISRQTALQFQEDDNPRLVKLLKEVFPDLKETAEAGVYTSKYGGVSWLIKNRV